MESDKARVLRIVQNAELVHPGRPLVEAFINDANDGEQAARFLLQKYAGGNSGVNFTKFVEDWKDLVGRFRVENSHSNNLSWASKKEIMRRDEKRCCLTGVRCRFWNIVDVFPIIPLTAFCIQEQHLNDMLGAFTTPYHQDLLRDRSPENRTRNYWTLCKDAAVAFSGGELRLEKLEDTKYCILYNDIGAKAPTIYTPQRYFDWECNLADKSSSGLETPDPELLSIHSRFSRALIWTNISVEIKSRPSVCRSQQADSRRLTQTLTTASLVIWWKFPDCFRFQIYKILSTAGLYLYGSTTRGVQRLPFGMYLKHGQAINADRHAGEFNALKLVRSQTSIPVPRPIDLLLSRTKSFLVTSRIEGETAGVSVDECSDEEIHQISQDLSSWIAELRAIKLDTNSHYNIASVTGGPCLDYRIGGDRVGPFHNEKEFSESLKIGALPDLMHRTDHEIVFTHADLNLRNILMKDGRISGIIDWENAGWYPEYWEYTKCHFSVSFATRWLDMMRTVFENKYETELAVERQYWAYNSPF